MKTPYEPTAARKRQGLTVERIAQLIGVHSRSVSRWEAERKLPKNLLLRQAYLTALGLPTEVQP